MRIFQVQGKVLIKSESIHISKHPLLTFKYLSQILSEILKELFGNYLEKFDIRLKKTVSFSDKFFKICLRKCFWLILKMSGLPAKVKLK